LFFIFAYLGYNGTWLTNGGRCRSGSSRAKTKGIVPPVSRKETMDSYDFCLAWNWEYDHDFVVLLEAACQSRGVSLLQITPDNLADLIAPITNGEIVFRFFWDRASDTDNRFDPIVQWARDFALYRINPDERAKRTWNKVNAHLTFRSAGLQTPHTIILPSYEEQPVLPPIDLEQLGSSFMIKPAHGGGGEGVIIGATCLSEVLSARQEYPDDEYLLQAQVVPANFGTHPAWFRVIYCAGSAYPSFWDPFTHIYTPVTFLREDHHSIDSLHELTAFIARICGLDLFSTELCVGSDDRLVVIDYINDPIDLRLQSRASDGVPDEIVHDVVGSLAALVADHCRPSITGERSETCPPQLAQHDASGLAGRRLAYILEECRNAFLHAEACRSSGAHFDFIVRVRGSDVKQNTLHPYVCISVTHSIMNSCETDFVSSVKKGMEICQHLIRQPPNETRAYQGTIYLNTSVWFSYQGSDRRLAERRQGERRQSERRSCGISLDQVRVDQRSHRLNVDRRKIDRRKQNRRKGDRRVSPML